MFYKLAVLVAGLAIAFILLSSKVQKTYAYRKQYYSYGYTVYYGTSISWYIWVVISGGIFGTIATVIICCFCCRRRRLNQPGTVVSYNNGVSTVAGSPYVTGAAPPPGQPYPQQPYPQQPYGYPTQPYPTPVNGQAPYPESKMPEPPSYATTGAPPSYGDASNGNPQFGNTTTTAPGNTPTYSPGNVDTPSYNTGNTDTTSYSYTNPAADTNP